MSKDSNLSSSVSTVFWKVKDTGPQNLGLVFFLFKQFNRVLSQCVQLVCDTWGTPNFKTVTRFTG